MARWLLGSVTALGLVAGLAFSASYQMVARFANKNTISLVPFYSFQTYLSEVLAFVEGNRQSTVTLAVFATASRLRTLQILGIDLFLFYATKSDPENTIFMYQFSVAKP